jgi:hypothetical protein
MQMGGNNPRGWMRWLGGGIGARISRLPSCTTRGALLFAAVLVVAGVVGVLASPLEGGARTRDLGAAQAGLAATPSLSPTALADGAPYRRQVAGTGRRFLQQRARSGHVLAAGRPSQSAGSTIRRSPGGSAATTGGSLLQSALGAGTLSSVLATSYFPRINGGVRRRRCEGRRGCE